MASSARVRRSVVLVVALGVTACADRPLQLPDEGRDAAERLPDAGAPDLSQFQPACTPNSPAELLTADVDSLGRAIAADESGVFYAGADETIRWISRQGGSSKVLIGETAQYLALVGGHLYTTRTTICGNAPCVTIIDFDLLGAVTKPVVQLPARQLPGPFAADETGLYWNTIANPPAGYIQSWEMGSIRTLLTTQSSAFGMALNAKELFVAPLSLPLYAIDRKTGATRTVVDASFGPTLVALDGDQLFFSTGAGEIMEVASAGGSPRRLSGSPYPGSMVVGKDAVYWSAANGIFRVDRQGGAPPHQLAGNRTFFSAPMALYGDCVFFVAETDTPLPVLPGGTNPPVALYKIHL